MSLENYSTMENMYSLFPFPYTYHSDKKEFKNVPNYNITEKKPVKKGV